VYRVLRPLWNPWITDSDVKLVGESDPITKKILAIRGERTAGIPSRYHDLLFAGMLAEEPHIYVPYVPLRLWIEVSYTRQGETNRWQARAHQQDLFRGSKAKGVGSYTTARREGEPEGSEKHATVGVLLEIGAEFDDPRVLNDPNVSRALKRQAAIEADEMFKSRHPDAEIEYVDDDERQAAAMRWSYEPMTSSNADALFIGGPYDGMEIGVAKINGFCQISPVGTKNGIRLLVQMPPRKDWERVLKGEITKEGPFEVLYSYERKFVLGSLEFHYCTEDGISKAMADH
jgi:hypothetical protein